MSLSLVLPGLVSVALGVLAGRVRWSMSPLAVLWFTTALATTASATAAGLVGVTALGLLASTAPLSSLIDWCPIIPLHHQVTLAVGGPAVAISALMARRVLAVFKERTRAVAGTSGKRMMVLDEAEPIAYAAPGTPGCVVVSSGLLSRLKPRERQVLFAHERAHLDQKHSRFLLVGSLAVAVLPPLKDLVDQQRLATERCADEAASLAMGGDRRLVAQAVVRAAVATTLYQGVAAGFGGASIPVRVEALVGDSRGRNRINLMAAVAGLALLSGFAFGSVQLHHLATVAEHLCGG